MTLDQYVSPSPATDPGGGVADATPPGVITFHTRVPEWVTYAGISDRAHRVYTVLMSHVNRNSGTWMTGVISQADLAAACGLKSSPERIGRYVAELEALGAAFAVEGWDEVRKIPETRYIVAFDPPPGYEGHRTRQSWQAERRQARSVRIANRRVKEQARQSRAALRAAPAGPLGLTVSGLGDLLIPAGSVTRVSAGHRTCNVAGLSTDVTTPDVKALQDKDGVPDAVGKSAGGYARAGAGEAAGDESGQAAGGCAASDKYASPPRTSSPRPRTVLTRPRREPAGFEDVRQAIPQAVARPGTRLYPGLHRAIVDLLAGGAGIPRRTPSQVIARVNRRWFGEQAEQRAAKGYRGCGRCTTSSCPSPRRSQGNPDGCDRIKNPSSWLAQAILERDCPDASCEDGVLINSSVECRACKTRKADERAAREAAARAEAMYAEQIARADAEREATRQLEDAAAHEEYRVTAELAAAGVFGAMLDHRVAGHMAAWRDLHQPRPKGAWPVISTPAPAEAAAAVLASVPYEPEAPRDGDGGQFLAPGSGAARAAARAAVTAWREAADAAEDAAASGRRRH